MARQKNDQTGADATDSQALSPEAAAAPAGLFAEVQDSIKAAVEAGDHATHGALAAIETCFVDLRARMAALEQGASDDVKAVIAKIKAIL